MKGILIGHLATAPYDPSALQVLAAANRTALAVAKAAGLQFVRAEGFVFGHVADEGWVGACAGPLLRWDGGGALTAPPQVPEGDRSRGRVHHL